MIFSVGKFLKKINEVKSEHRKQRNSLLQNKNKIVKSQNIELQATKTIKCRSCQVEATLKSTLRQLQKRFHTSIVREFELNSTKMENSCK